MWAFVDRRRGVVVMTLFLLSLLLLVIAFGIALADDHTSGFTPTYRNWTRVSVAHIASNAVFDDPELNPAGADLTGFLTIYANDIALENYLDGKEEPFPEGSVIVAESTSFTALGDTGVSLEGEPRLTVWMIKDPQAPEETGGWRWELWTVEDGEHVNAELDVPSQVAACVICHTQMLDGVATQTDLVFSTFTDLAHAEEYHDTIHAEATEAP
jgi:hypothetical protein